MKNKIGWIYVFKNKVNEMCYVGQTIDFKKRIKAHSRQKTNTYFDRIFQKYLEDFELVEKLLIPKEYLNEQEDYFINKYNSRYPNGYNLMPGGCGQGGYERCENSIEKQKKSLNHFYSTPEGKEQAKKHSKRMKGRYDGSNNPNYGNHKVAGKNNPMFGIRRYGKENPNSKKILLISPKGKEFRLPNKKISCRQFCLNNNLSQGCISEVLQGRQKQHKGWTARYLSK